MKIRKRKLLSTALALFAVPAWAQPNPPQYKILGVFSVLGDTIDVSTAQEPSASRIDRTERKTLEVRNLGLDRLVAQEFRSAIQKDMPRVLLHLFGASAPLRLEDQRQLAEQARSGALPGWVVDLIQERQLDHVVLVTRESAAVQLETATAETAGRSEVAGIGFHIDMAYRVRNTEANVVGDGALGPHVVVRLTLFDTREAKVLRTQLINEQWLVGPPDTPERSQGPWAYLSAEQKIMALRDGLSRGLQKQLRSFLRGG